MRDKACDHRSNTTAYALHRMLSVYMRVEGSGATVPVGPSWVSAKLCTCDAVGTCAVSEAVGTAPRRSTMSSTRVYGGEWSDSARGAQLGMCNVDKSVVSAVYTASSQSKPLACGCDCWAVCKPPLGAGGKKQNRGAEARKKPRATSLCSGGAGRRAHVRTRNSSLPLFLSRIIHLHPPPFLRLEAQHRKRICD